MNSQTEFFNRVAKDWDNICYHDSKKIDYMLDLLNIKEDMRILDIGTGTGILVPYISKLSKNGSIVAIDMAENMIEIARERYSHLPVEFIVADILEMEFEEKFDIIICYSMFPHFKDRQIEAIEKLSCFLKDKGLFMIGHSQSREAINSMHQESDDRVKNDDLPEIYILEKYFTDNQLQITNKIDNDEMFLIIGQK